MRFDYVPFFAEISKYFYLNCSCLDCKRVFEVVELFIIFCIISASFSNLPDFYLGCKLIWDAAYFFLQNPILFIAIYRVLKNLIKGNVVYYFYFCHLNNIILPFQRQNMLFFVNSNCVRNIPYINFEVPIRIYFFVLFPFSDSD